MHQSHTSTLQIYQVPPNPAVKRDCGTGVAGFLNPPRVATPFQR